MSVSTVPVRETSVQALGTDSPPVIQRALERLIENWNAYFPGATATPSIRGLSTVRRPLSDIARVDLKAGASRIQLFVKAHKKAGSDPQQVRTKATLEFETLRTLHARFQARPDFTVARPIALFPDDLVVVTEAVPGERLHGMLKRQAARWRGPAVVSRLAAHCRAAGTWLRHFQEITHQERMAPLPAEGLRGRIAADLDRCVHLGLPQARAAEMLRFADARLAELASVALPVVGVHPDFQPDNILVSGQRVAVLDFTSFQYGPSHSDVARFLVALEFMTKHPFYPEIRARMLMAAFLAGYGRETREPPGALAVYILRGFVRSAGSALAWSSSGVIRSVIRRQIDHFLGRWGERMDAILTLAARTVEPRER